MSISTLDGGGRKSRSERVEFELSQIFRLGVVAALP